MVAGSRLDPGPSPGPLVRIPVSLARCPRVRACGPRAPGPRAPGPGGLLVCGLTALGRPVRLGRIRPGDGWLAVLSIGSRPGDRPGISFGRRSAIDGPGGGYPRSGRSAPHAAVGLAGLAGQRQLEIFQPGIRRLGRAVIVVRRRRVPVREVLQALPQVGDRSPLWPVAWPVRVRAARAVRRVRARQLDLISLVLGPWHSCQSLAPRQPGHGRPWRVTRARAFAARARASTTRPRASWPPH